MPSQYGYYFHPPEGEYPVGYLQLDFNLYEEPTGQHFDPRHVTLPVVNKESHIELLTLSHPWHSRTDYQVCAGRISLQDHKGKSVEAFTLGGRLTLEKQDTYTSCSLTSPAPIIDLPDPRATSTLLVNEIECVLAHRRAALAHEKGKFDQRLMAVDPLNLFIACLSALEAKLCRLSSAGMNGPSYENVLMLAHKIIHSLQKQGVWERQLYTLPELL